MIKAAKLMETQKLIADPQDWIKGNFAKDVRGNVVPSYNLDAQCFCTIGAMLRTCRTEAEEYKAFMMDCFRDWNKDPTIYGIVEFNDHPNTTHSDVLTFFDFVIARAIEQEKPR